jgi:hypothetical protein
MILMLILEGFMLIYVAGPYRAKNGRSVADNIKAARAISGKLWQSGHYAVTPHLNTAGFEELYPDVSDKTWLDGTLEMLRRCDAIVMTETWQESEGAISEHAYAESVGMPIYVWPDMPPANLTEQRCPEQCKGFIDTVMSMYRVHLSKNSDYSPANILGCGETGVIVRAWDKIARLLNLYGFNIHISEPATLSPPRSPKHESINDTWLDMAVYGVIGLLVRKGTWGKY